MTSVNDNPLTGITLPKGTKFPSPYQVTIVRSGGDAPTPDLANALIGSAIRVRALGKVARLLEWFRSFSPVPRISAATCSALIDACVRSEDSAYVKLAREVYDESVNARENKSSPFPPPTLAMHMSAVALAERYDDLELAVAAAHRAHTLSSSSSALHSRVFSLAVRLTVSDPNRPSVVALLPESERGEIARGPTFRSRPSPTTGAVVPLSVRLARVISCLRSQPAWARVSIAPHALHAAISELASRLASDVVQHAPGPYGGPPFKRGGPGECVEDVAGFYLGRNWDQDRRKAFRAPYECLVDLVAAVERVEEGVRMMSVRQEGDTPLPAAAAAGTAVATGGGLDVGSVTLSRSACLALLAVASPMCFCDASLLKAASGAISRVHSPVEYVPRCALMLEWYTFVQSSIVQAAGGSKGGGDPAAESVWGGEAGTSAAAGDTDMKAFVGGSEGHVMALPVAVAASLHSRWLSLRAASDVVMDVREAAIARRCLPLNGCVLTAVAVASLSTAPAALGTLFDVFEVAMLEAVGGEAGSFEEVGGDVQGGSAGDMFGVEGVSQFGDDAVGEGGAGAASRRANALGAVSCIAQMILRLVTHPPPTLSVADVKASLKLSEHSVLRCLLGLSRSDAVTVERLHEELASSVDGIFSGAVSGTTLHSSGDGDATMGGGGTSSRRGEGDSGGDVPFDEAGDEVVAGRQGRGGEGEAIEGGRESEGSTVQLLANPPRGVWWLTPTPSVLRTFSRVLDALEDPALGPFRASGGADAVSQTVPAAGGVASTTYFMKLTAVAAQHAQTSVGGAFASASGSSAHPDGTRAGKLRRAAAAATAREHAAAAADRAALVSLASEVERIVDVSHPPVVLDSTRLAWRTLIALAGTGVRVLLHPLMTLWLLQAPLSEAEGAVAAIERVRASVVPFGVGLFQAFVLSKTLSHSREGAGALPSQPLHSLREGLMQPLVPPVESDITVLLAQWVARHKAALSSRIGVLFDADAPPPAVEAAAQQLSKTCSESVGVAATILPIPVLRGE